MTRDARAASTKGARTVKDTVGDASDKLKDAVTRSDVHLPGADRAQAEPLRLLLPRARREPPPLSGHAGGRSAPRAKWM